MGSTAVEEPQVEGQEQEDGAPVEEGAEATRANAHLFAYSKYVHAPEGAEQCEHATDGHCDDPDHFHAWVCLPNSIQMRDIEEKARAARARKRRAMLDAGGDGKPPADSYVILESELDDLFMGDLSGLIALMAEREVTKRLSAIAEEVREDDEQFENQAQDAEEFGRLLAMPEDERPAEEFERLEEQMTKYGEAVKTLYDQELNRETARIKGLSQENLRAMFRENRLDNESESAGIVAHYLWLAFVCTRKVRPVALQKDAPRYFESLERLRSAAPEAVEAIDQAVQDLEGRLVRGDASGN